jgi:aromatic aminotransferase
VQTSRRVEVTDSPVIVKTKLLMAGKSDVLSLAQGIVHWPPPPEALCRSAELLVSNPSIHSYGPCEGLPALRDALKEKLRACNGLHDVRHGSKGWPAFMPAVLDALVCR